MGGGGGGIGGGNMTEEGMRWQMQIQEDVSFKFCFAAAKWFLSAKHVISLAIHERFQMDYTTSWQMIARFFDFTVDGMKDLDMQETYESIACISSFQTIL